MRYEIPPREVLEGEIRGFNRNFTDLAQRGQGNLPFIYNPGKLEQMDMADSTTTASFWKHFIGGQTSAMHVMIYTFRGDSEQFPYNRDLIKTVQWECYSRTKIWQQHPKNANTPLEKESYAAFLKTCTSFDWTTTPPELIEELADIVSGVGNAYNMLEGRLPLSMLMHNLREEGKIP